MTALTMLTLSLLTAAPDLPLEPFSYHEGWEQDGPALDLWAKNGESEVLFSGPTEERAFEGTHSYKLEIELKGGSYHYFGVPLRVPVVGPVKLSARLLVAEGTTATVGFGTNFVFPPTHHSGCSPRQSFDKPTGEWQLVEVELLDVGRAMAATVLPHYTATVLPEDVGLVLDRYSLFIRGGAGQRVVVYLDDVRVEGSAPDAAAHLQWAAARFEAARARLGERLARWRATLTEAEAGLANLPVPAGYESKAAALAESAATVRGRLEAIERRGYADSTDLSEVESLLRSLRYGPAGFRAVAAAAAAGRPVVIFTAPAIRNDSPVLGQFPIPAEPAERLGLSGCRGEYESATMILYAREPVRGLRVDVAPFRSGGAAWPADVVDVRWVKCWYQAGRGIGDLHNKRLVPELLLKDDALVRVDVEAQQNYLRDTRLDGGEEYLLCSGPSSEGLAGVRPYDAETLQPIDLAAEELRQVWLTVRVPDDAEAGVWRAPVAVEWEGGRTELELELTVHPFELAAPRLIYSIYYRARLDPEDEPHIDSERRSEEQYRAEMADLKAHGVLYPTNYQAWDDVLLPRILQIRKEAGLPPGPFFNLGLGTGNRADEASLRALEAQVRRWRDLLAGYGWDPVYFYGIDEATGELLESQKAAWATVQQAGGRTFVACYHKTFEAMGRLLNLAVLAGRPDPAEAEKWHSVGSLAFCYANPQVGPEEPETFRRNFGVLLWRAGFDGAMDYAYQHGFGHVWNDFDDRTYRDHNFAYPTVNGVVPTVQWEGFREAVDDVRYLTTLEQAIARRGDADPTARAARAWLDSIDADSIDLEELRGRAVQWLIELSR